MDNKQKRHIRPFKILPITYLYHKFDYQLQAMKINTTILFFLFGITSFGQQSSSKEEVYQILRAHSIFHQPYMETAKNSFRNFVATHPADPYRLIASYWLAEILNKLNNSDSARLLYSQVLDMSVPDSVDDGNYRRSSAIRLAEINMADNDYCAALSHLDLARKFILRYDCGNARIEDDIRMKVLYSKCYLGQGDYRRAIDTLAPCMFGSWSKDNKLIISTLYEAYLNIHTKEEIKNEFLNLEKGLVIRPEKHYSYSYFQPAVKVFDNEIEFQDHTYSLNKLTEREQKQKCMETIKQSAIYKLATH